MAPSPRLGLGLLLLGATWLPSTAALEFDICAGINTGIGAGNYSDLQTNGLCHDFCFANYAYAVTKDYLCWCSDYTPAKSEQVDDSECNIPCHGYPDEHCGGPNAFGYVLLNNILPSGTLGGDDPETTSTTTRETTTTAEPERVTETIQNTVTVSQIISETEAPSSTTSRSSSSKSSKTADSTTDLTTEVATTSFPTISFPTTSFVQTVTADGTVKTVTVVPTPNPDISNSDQNLDGDSQSGGGGGVGAGAIAGAVVGGLAGLALILFAVFFWRRRQRRQTQDKAYQEDPSIRDGSADVMRGHRPEMSMSNRSGGPPSSPNSAGNRNSQIDPRMDPKKLWVRSASHESVNTIRDDHDYSRPIQENRVLRAMNPDPDNE